MVNLDKYSKVLSMDTGSRIVTVQAGLRIRDLCAVLRDNGLALPNLGSINEQSIAGAMATGTHGSSLRHGLMSQSVLGLKITLANGRSVSCSAEQNLDLFRAALVSLGALGIVTEVTLKVVPDFNIEWEQHLRSQDVILSDWTQDLWTKHEFTRVWLFPYMKQCVLWTADQTHKPHRAPKSSWFSGRLGYHIYHLLLYVGQYVPRMLPAIEKFVISVQYGGAGTSAVEEGRTGLLMNCMYSQLVNEWAVPLHRGPEALTRLSAWLHGDNETAAIPYDSRGIWVHAPIEVRVTDSSNHQPRAYLDNTMPDGPSLLLNATLYRPYDADPPCHVRYYEAFEWLMKEMGGRPHWAKNFHSVSVEEFQTMYPELPEYLRVRNEFDPEGMFLGDWHRRHLLGHESDSQPFPLEEHELKTEARVAGGYMWHGEVVGRAMSPQNSEESFDMVHGAEAEKSAILDDTSSMWR